MRPEHSNHLGEADVEYEEEHRQGQCLEGPFAPECHQSAQRPRRDRRRSQDQHGLDDLLGVDPADQEKQCEDGDGDEQLDDDGQQCAQHLAENDFVIPHVGQQKQNECSAVFFLRHRPRGRKSCEKERQQQLDEGDDLEQEQAERGGLAESCVAREADGGLPGGDAEDRQQADERGPARVVPCPPRDSDQLAREDRTQHVDLSRCRVSGYRVSGVGCRVSGVGCRACRVSGIVITYQCMVRCYDTRPDTRYPIPDTRTRYPIPDTRYPIPDTRYPIPDTRYPIPDTRYPIPDTRYPITCMQSSSFFAAVRPAGSGPTATSGLPRQTSIVSPRKGSCSTVTSATAPIPLQAVVPGLTAGRMHTQYLSRTC